MSWNPISSTPSSIMRDSTKLKKSRHWFSSRASIAALNGPRCFSISSASQRQCDRELTVGNEYPRLDVDVLFTRRRRRQAVLAGRAVPGTNGLTNPAGELCYPRASYLISLGVLILNLRSVTGVTFELPPPGRSGGMSQSTSSHCESAIYSVPRTG